MAYKDTVVITGVKRSQGIMEGRPYDSTKVYVQTSLDTSKGDAVGHAGGEYSWGTSANFNKLASLTFPLKAELTLERVTTGRNERTILIDVQPLPLNQTK